MWDDEWHLLEYTTQVDKDKTLPLSGTPSAQ